MQERHGTPSRDGRHSGSGGRDRQGQLSDTDQRLRPPRERFRYFSGTDARNRPIPRRELFDEEAEEVARCFSTIRSSQLRRFYGAVTSLKRQIELDHDAFPDETLRARLALLKAHAAYAHKRVNMPDAFVAFFTRHADAVQTKDDFRYGFAPHFEAVIAYHKIYEKEQGRD